MAPKHQAVLAQALRIPATNKLSGKRVILASNSPRRKEILKTCGLRPEIVPSNFKEDLAHSSFADVHEYPVATATQKAVEVYERLVTEQPEDGPDLVIGADTVVLTHNPGSSSADAGFSDPEARPEILEKPTSKVDNLRMLLELNGGVCEIVTGVCLVYPILTAPGYAIKSLDERTLVHFADNSRELLEAYADSGEGLDRAGGFAIQGLGGLLVSKIDGDYNNVVGFPAASFFKLLDLLVEEEDDFLDV
ncbi:Maf/Ham1 [Sistotremastrum suecicum HHB10207 ss-3]|uniref:Maf/Ham1 n=1 Tax=Sistotremastrum suecicum HHB10207 ss-3 TaxID=1314776 RepID=A0A166EVY1_9AGAM|nr:Maf/Ham1 [Sistotremastrum suecicum HHB10207 ss-3]